LDDWKRNLAREAHPTTDLILIRNQYTCIQKDKPKNNNKIRKHKKQTHLSISPLLFSCPTPFLLVHPDNRQQAHAVSPLPPQQPATEVTAATILHNPMNI
jgi:hypothetical protein